MSEDEEDWGEWKGDGRRAHDDQRRPRSPTLPPTHFRAPVNQIELLHLHAASPQRSPSQNSHFLRCPMVSQAPGRLMLSRRFPAISRSPQNPCRHNSLFSLASAKRAGHIFARPHGHITSSRPTRRKPRRTSSGPLLVRASPIDCYLISIAHSHIRRFSGPIIPICRLPSAFCEMRS